MRDDGFSLIEILIAVFLMALLSTLGMVMLNSALSAKDQLNQVVAETEELQLARAVIREDLSQMVLRTNKDELGQPRANAFEGGRYSSSEPLFSFVTNGRERVDPQTKLSSLQFVSYRFENSQLIRDSRDHLDPAPDTPINSRVMIEDIRDLDVTFYNGVDWEEYWNGYSATNDGGVNAPLAVRFVLTTPRYQEVELFFATSQAF